LDVVPADPKEWKTPPFSGEVKDGAIWGRGALDDKGPGVVFLMSMLAVKRAGILLDRDILFVATGDEEEGGKDGAGWFVDHQQPVYSDVGYVLNEGGGIRMLSNKRVYYAVAVTEKTPLWLRVTASGPTGHSSQPPAETSVTELLHGLQRLVEYHPPIHLIGPVEDYFRAMAELGEGPKQWLDLAAALRDPVFQKQFLAVPEHNALVRDTLTPTVLGASSAVNVLPATAYAELDGRLLPGSDSKAVLATIDKALNDRNLKTEVVRNWPPVSSPHKSELMSAIQALARHMDKDAPVLPTLIAGFTDSHYFRQKGIIAYGFVPIEVTHPEELKGIHGNDERISVDELGGGIRRTVELLKIMGGR
jgi:acetylornithine deacetylase/succinyl-diaminopimelate desuccinylase-like protein